MNDEVQAAAEKLAEAISKESRDKEADDALREMVAAKRRKDEVALNQHGIRNRTEGEDE